ncbi:MAG: YjgN family protein [Pseudobdellovibrionaceae bacterium]
MSDPKPPLEQIPTPDFAYVGEASYSLESEPERPAPHQRKKPVFRVGYQGKAGDIMGLHIVNLLLSIITLGIYSFWGKTRIRRYMSSHLVLGKDRFQYTGTGQELFIGWLKALIIFAPVTFGLAIPFVNFFIYPIFFGVLATAGFLALRYRLSRTRWRGIGFNMGGHAGHYLWLSIKRALLNFVTMGISIPSSDIKKWSYMAGHMRYGAQEFTYEGDHKRIFQTHIITAVIGVGLYMLWGFYFMQHAASLQMLSALEGQDPAQVTEQQRMQVEAAVHTLIWGVIIPLYGIVGVSLLARVWYTAALWREKFRGLQAGEVRFKLDITGGQLAWLQISNLLIVILTLGLASPITTHRTLRFFASHLRVGGDINSLVVKQDRVKRVSGFGDAMAADVGFDLGL